MADRVLVRVTRNLTDMHEGDQAWVVETEAVAGMVAGGYFAIIDRAAQPTKGKTGGADQAESR